ncbi:MAG: helix-turn-helix transcriptional regulator [Planctomycetia bacterium]|jgi:AraC-like DNA-binding protein
MDGATLSPYPHYSWLAHRIAVRPPNAFAFHEERHVGHRLLLTTAGEARITWTSRGNEQTFRSAAGDIGFYPRDDATHGQAITAAGGYEAYAVGMPEHHLRELGTSDGVRGRQAFHAMPVFRDAVIQASLLRLAEGSGCRQISENIGDEIAARQIVIRLSALVGGRPPDWQRDASVFTPAVMRQVVEHVDAHLAGHPTLEQTSRCFGLSPSHFARKFQRSTGLSLNRFINRRRIGRALAVLAAADTPLAQLSLDLGFCSQSHFTRLFRGLTGITPLRFGRGRAAPDH